MRYPDAAAFRQALEQRLNACAGGDGARLARNRKRVAFDRLIARLNLTAPARWLLKGGFALDLRLPEHARATRDVDIDWQATEQELLETLIEAAALDADDHFTFQIERTGTPPERLGGSHRFRITATLAGRQFESFPLDVGLRADPITEPDMLTTPDFLSFADIDPVEVPAVPLELQIAEKVHAYTRTYEGARASTRVKDLVDLALITDLSMLDAARLRDAITKTFAQRAEHEPPTQLPRPPVDWSAPYRALAEAVSIAPSLDAGYAAAARLLDPILHDGVTEGRWDPEAQAWTTMTCSSHPAVEAQPSIRSGGNLSS